MQLAMLKYALADALYCGDEVACWQKDEQILLCVVDGLGHGQQAEEAAKKAVRYIERHLLESLEEIFAGCNRALRETRGVAMAVARIDEKKRLLTYAGVGNTRAVVVGDKTTWLNSSYGIIGGGYKALSPEVVPFSPSDLLLLFTDGLPEFIDLSKYSKEIAGDVWQLAAKIITDWYAKKDDVAILVYRSEVL